MMEADTAPLNAHRSRLGPVEHGYPLKNGHPLNTGQGGCKDRLATTRVLEKGIIMLNITNPAYSGGAQCSLV